VHESRSTSRRLRHEGGQSTGRDDAPRVDEPERERSREDRECEQDDDRADPHGHLHLVAEDVVPVVVEDEHAHDEGQQHDRLAPGPARGLDAQLTGEADLLPGVALCLEHAVERGFAPLPAKQR